ncbi:MAG: flagellar basal body protein [Alphaproteobacteria bacterium]
MSITGTLSAAISGLQAQSVRLNVAANNIANLRTEGYQALRLDTSTLTTQQTTGTGYAPGGVLVSVSPTIGEDAGVDLGREITNLILAEISYKANASLIRSAEELARTALDLKA